MAKSNKARVLAVVAAIPEGRVTTYGTIGKRLNLTARQVARVLATLSVDESVELSWFRVVAAQGAISSMKLGAVGRRQIERLRSEGVEVSLRNKVVNFESVVWQK